MLDVGQVTNCLQLEPNLSGKSWKPSTEVGKIAGHLLIVVWRRHCQGAQIENHAVLSRC